jgi:hypothetical protein
MNVHNLMGFHDNSAIEQETGRQLRLRVNFIDRPPVKGDQAEVLVCNWDGGKEEVVALTDAWNFPQGGRQQWVGPDRICFNKSEGDIWTGVIVDLQTRARLHLQKPVYTVSSDGLWGYGINFSRLHRLGGYGYIGLDDLTAKGSAPAKDGIWRICMGAGKAELLFSIRDVAGSSSAATGAHHYFTHLSLSPNGKSLAFLHRYWLPDGGIQTRLMVAELKGGKFECWGEGFLSHFDWADDNSILIWGRPNSSLQQHRSHPLLQNRLARLALPMIKPFARLILGGRQNNGSAYRLLKSAEIGECKQFAPDLLQEDGHPSYRPKDRKVLLTDTYPDKKGIRRLMLCVVDKPNIIELGRFKQVKMEPDASRLKEASQGIDPWVLKAFSNKHFVYSRSGIHCDLHPRWRWDGNAVCFDSNHDGHRDVYALETPDLNIL